MKLRNKIIVGIGGLAVVATPIVVASSSAYTKPSHVINSNSEEVMSNKEIVSIAKNVFVESYNTQQTVAKQKNNGFYENNDDSEKIQMLINDIGLLMLDEKFDDAFQLISDNLDENENLPIENVFVDAFGESILIDSEDEEFHTRARLRWMGIFTMEMGYWTGFFSKLAFSAALGKVYFLVTAALSTFMGPFAWLASLTVCTMFGIWVNNAIDSVIKKNGFVDRYETFTIFDTSIRWFRNGTSTWDFTPIVKIVFEIIGVVWTMNKPAGFGNKPLFGFAI